jgi:hypothetical protein
MSSRQTLNKENALTSFRLHLPVSWSASDRLGRRRRAWVEVVDLAGRRSVCSNRLLDCRWRGDFRACRRCRDWSDSWIIFYFHFTETKQKSSWRNKNKSTREDFELREWRVTLVGVRHFCVALLCYLQWLWWIASEQSSIISCSVVGLVRLAIWVRSVDRIQRIHRLIVVVIIAAWRRRLFASWRCHWLRSIATRRCLRLRLWLLGRDSQFI